MARIDTHERNGHTLMCRCGHPRSMHAHGKDCLSYDRSGRFNCRCKEFKEKGAKE